MASLMLLMKDPLLLPRPLFVDNNDADDTDSNPFADEEALVVVVGLSVVGADVEVDTDVDVAVAVVVAVESETDVAVAVDADAVVVVVVVVVDTDAVDVVEVNQSDEDEDEDDDSVADVERAGVVDTVVVEVEADVVVGVSEENMTVVLRLSFALVGFLRRIEDGGTTIEVTIGDDEDNGGDDEDDDEVDDKGRVATLSSFSRFVV